MKVRYLEVTYREGKPLAAYLYLPRESGATSVRTEKVSRGLLVDYDGHGEPIGLEITEPGHVSVEQVNRALAALGLPEAAPEELAPLPAA